MQFSPGEIMETKHYSLFVDKSVSVYSNAEQVSRQVSSYIAST